MPIGAQLLIGFLVYVPLGTCTYALAALAPDEKGERIFDTRDPHHRSALTLIAFLWPVSLAVVIFSFWVMFLTNFFSRLGGKK